MQASWRWLSWTLLAHLYGCSRNPSAELRGSPDTARPSTASTAGQGAATSPADRAPVLAPGLVPDASSNALEPAWQVSTFASSAQALAHVLAARPRVLAIGEAHAPAPSSDEPAPVSATQRFREQLLPTLAPRASHLILELWVVDPRCKKADVAQVASATREVTKGQSKHNATDFELLAAEARRRKVKPSVLVPTCAEYTDILDAGPGDIDAMLRMIARLTERDLQRAIAASSDDQVVLAYGGAMHNDLYPRPGNEPYSFAGAVDRATQGRLVELDLIPAEFVRDTEVWQRQAWYATYRANVEARAWGSKDEVVLLQRGRSYVWFFARRSTAR